MRRDRGFALLLVLWSLVLLALVTTRLIAGGRDEARLAGNLRAAAAAEMLADSAVNEAAFRLLVHTPGWAADAAARRLTLPGGTVALRIEDEAGRINPNQASEAVLQALLQAAGADRGTAQPLAAAIMDWRSAGSTTQDGGAKAAEYRAAGRQYGPPQAPFRSLDELGFVLGMTPALLDRLRPYLTLYYDGDADPDVADPVVLEVLRRAAGQADIGGSRGTGVRTVRVTAAAETSSGGRFTRQAVLRLAPDGARPYRLLDWRRADG